MKSKLFYSLFAFILLISFVSAETEIYKVNQNIDLRFTCTTGSQLPSAATTFSITVSYPNGTIFINNQAATALGNGLFNYTTMFKETGLYSVQMICIDGANSYSSTGYYDITPTGAIQTSILNQPILIILGLLGLILVLFGATKGIPWFGFIGAIMFLLLGVYTMVYGFNNTTDLYTRSVAMVFIGMGFIFMFTSSYEWLYDEDSENDGGYSGEEED